jgi:hypothetical protein
MPRSADFGRAHAATLLPSKTFGNPRPRGDPLTAYVHHHCTTWRGTDTRCERRSGMRGSPQYPQQNEMERASIHALGIHQRRSSGSFAAALACPGPPPAARWLAAGERHARGPPAAFGDYEGDISFTVCIHTCRTQQLVYTQPGIYMSTTYRPTYSCVYHTYGV